MNTKCIPLDKQSDEVIVFVWTATLYLGNKAEYCQRDKCGQNVWLRLVAYLNT